MNLPRVPVEAGPLSKASIADRAMVRSLLLMNSRDMLRQMQLKVKTEATSRAWIRSGAFMNGTTMLEHCRAFRKRLSTSIACKVSSLEMHGTKVAILRTDMSECSRTLLTLERLQLFMNRPDMQSQMAASCERTPTRTTCMRL